MREAKIPVNMDMEKGRTPKPGAAANVFILHIRQTTQINMGVVQAYLQGKVDFDNHVLEAISKSHSLNLTCLC